MNLYYKLKSDKGYGYVILIYTHLSKRIELSPSVKCSKKDFGDGKKDNPIKKTDNEFEGKNQVLRSFKENVYLVIERLKSENIIPSTELVKLGMKQFKRELLVVKHNETLVDRFPILYVLKEKYIKSLDKTTTYYRSICYRLRIVEDFIKLKGDLEIDFREIDNMFYTEFESYLVQKQYSNSTSAKIISQFRQFLLFAQRENFVNRVNVDYKTKLPVGSKKVVALNQNQIETMYNYREFDYYPINDEENEIPSYIKHYKGWVESSYLIKDELFETIKDLETNRAKRDSKGMIVGMVSKNKFNYYTTYEVVKDMFLFSVATGLRWSDCVKVKVGDFDIENLEYSIIQQKTKDEVPIIENQLSKQLYRKYSKGKSVLQYLFPLNCLKSDFTRQNYLTKVNLHLKEIGEILKFNNSVYTIRRVGKNPTKNPSVPFYKLMSFHMGRRTHATIGNKLGVDMKSISQQMGHSSMSMTSKYIGKDDDKLKSLFDFINPSVKKELLAKNVNGNSLESKLEYLKSMKEKGVIPDEIYSNRVNDLLNEFGL
ncbi:tyrosine-type recombinase/integrase [Arenimonas sp.]|jgi:integrase|uniref:tyrosine-type recombinase/integrase n=1 Tax=Arenimonas sp. TaxID=1872635 RepID=UPI0037BED0F2